MPQATSRTQPILETAHELLAAARPLIDAQGLTLVGLSLTNLEDEDRVQLALPFERLHDAALDAALDRVRDRFGSSAVTRAVLLGRDPGVVMPLLPD
jgi:DNA polymerase-4